MSKISFGEIDWNSAETSPSNDSSKNIFMRLKQGDNIVRILSNPIQYYVHWVETEQGKRKVTSPIDSPELITKLEDAGFRRQVRWILRVMDQEDSQPKLLEVGSQIFNGVIALINNPKWGSVNKYDVTITRGAPGQNPLYRVTPNPKENISAEDKTAFNSFLAEVSVDKMIQPSPAKKVCEIMGWDSSKYSKHAEEYKDDDFDFDF